MKKIISSLLFIFTILFVFSGCEKEFVDFTSITKPGKDSPDIINDIDGDTSLADTIKYASDINDIAEAYYGNPERTSYVMKNKDMKIVHTLNKKHNTATLYDNEGNLLLKDAFEAELTINKKTYSSADSKTEGRVNTIRLGEYYDECHIRDFSFTDDLKLDKTFHLYGDKLYVQYSLLSTEPTADITSFNSVVRIPVDSVEELSIKDNNGIHNSLDYNAASAEYVAFDIRNIGVLGFIIPSDGSVESVAVYEDNGYYVINFVSAYDKGGLNDINGNGGYLNNSLTFGYRIVTDKEHNFNTVEATAYAERNPLNEINVTGGNGDGQYLLYDSLSGAYLFSIKGTDFNTAYQNPELQYSMSFSVENDSIDRNIYIRTKGDNGCLEAAALLDDNDILVPVNVQVCKNFCGDGGEPFYSAADTQYGDSIFPLSMKADSDYELTLLNLYQNWGKYPLKQLSSIEFHTSYYHLSTGTTESNCIAPYFVFGKDGWTLPDFRTASGIMWDTQPQYNSEGVLKFMTYRDGKKEVYSEYVYGDIASAGQTYSDITNTYFSDCGSYKYLLRHVEFPQTDENRTYYTLEVEFLKETSFSNFRKDFDLFYFDGRFVKFNNASYVDENGEICHVAVNKDKSPEYYVLGDAAPYWGFYDITDDTAGELENNFGCNFALIIKNSEITLNEEISDINLVFRDSSDDEITVGALTLDADKIKFTKGDRIKIDMILLPWGTGTEESDVNAQNVRSDSALNAFEITAVTGTVVEDDFIPAVMAVNNIAEFKIKGGKGNIAVRTDGFDSIECPEISMITPDGEIPLELSSSNGYDGYSVYYNNDGTYSFSFVYTADNEFTEYAFRVVQ